MNTWRKQIGGIICLLILICYLFGVFLLLVPLYYDEYHSNFLFHLTLGSLLAFGFLYLYYQLFTTDPGRVPVDWAPEQSKSPSCLYKFSSLNADRDIHCFKCNQWKPPRAHHCKQCNRCILKMDHHCPWIGNCVGFKNQKLFVQFLIVAPISILYLIYLIFLRLHQLYDLDLEQSSGFIFGIISILCLFPISVITVGLLIIQLKQLSSNSTGIEDVQNMTKFRQADESGKDFYDDSLYDLGDWKENFKENLGHNVWRWFIPSEVEGDGFSFRINEDFMDDIQAISQEHII